jgi:transposase-like protein
MLAIQEKSPSMDHKFNDRAPLQAVPNPEVLERPKRRKYTAEYKWKILKEIEAATQPGQIGAILRREGLYMSNIQCWRWQKERGELEALSPKKRGRKPTEAELLIRRNKELERENRKLQKRLKRAELLLDIQKKISEITGIPLREVENDEEY